MHPKRNWLEIISGRIVSGGLFVGKIFLAAMISIVFINVILRYIFHSPLIWGDEAMMNLMIMMVFFTTGAVMLENGHIRISFIVERLPQGAQNILNILTCLIAVGYVGFLIYAGSVLASKTIKRGIVSDTTNWPYAPFHIMMVCGLVIIFIATVWFTIRTIRTAKERINGLAEKNENRGTTPL